jgi:hypothetical protein
MKCWQSKQNFCQPVRPNNRFQSDGLAAPILRVSYGYHAISIYEKCLLQGRG